MEVGESLWEQARLHQKRIQSTAITHRHLPLDVFYFKLQPQGQNLCAHDL